MLQALYRGDHALLGGIGRYRHIEARAALRLCRLKRADKGLDRAENVMQVHDVDERGEAVRSRCRVCYSRIGWHHAADYRARRGWRQRTLVASRAAARRREDGPLRE